MDFFSKQKIRVSMISAGGDMNSLSNPELLSKLKEELKAQVRAELEAELAAEFEDKPKRKKKAIQEVSDEPTLDTADLFESFSNPQL
jgi:hypothetical protein